MTEIDHSLTLRFGSGGGIMVTVPASSIEEAKTAYLISGKPLTVEVTCILSYMPDSLIDIPDPNEDIFL